jgi:hypothetical protein
MPHQMHNLRQQLQLREDLYTAAEAEELCTLLLLLPLLLVLASQLRWSSS